MFVGHYAVALALKGFDQRVPLTPLFFGVQVLDIASAAFVLVGIEHWRIVPGITQASPLALDIPYTHGFLTSLGWAALAYLVMHLFPAPTMRLRVRTAAFVGIAVWSHWWLDLVVHRPDLPLYDRTFDVGLGLWYSLPGTWIIETGILVIGLIWYLRTSVARTLAGRVAMPVFVTLLVLLNSYDLFGPPPASESMLVISAEVAYFALAFAAFWVQRYRVPA